jgi:hypothetical protein
VDTLPAITPIKNKTEKKKEGIKGGLVDTFRSLQDCSYKAARPERPSFMQRSGTNPKLQKAHNAS